LCQLLEMLEIAHRDKGLDVRLQAQSWTENDVGTRREVEGLASEFTVDVVIGCTVFIIIDVADPLGISVVPAITRPQTHLKRRAGPQRQSTSETAR